jgi:hypothetical protein
MLTFNEQEVKDLDKFIQEMPTKYGMPLLNFINSKITEQVKKEIPVDLLKEENK